MIAPKRAKSAFLSTDQGKNPESAVFVFVKASDSYPMPRTLGFLKFKKFLNVWFFPSMQVSRASRLIAKYLPSQARRPRYNSEVSYGNNLRNCSTDTCASKFVGFRRCLYQSPIAFKLMEYSAGVSPTIVSRSMSGETSGIHKRLIKFTTLDNLVLLMDCFSIFSNEFVKSGYLLGQSESHMFFQFPV